ncbi:MAG: fused response regulator/phosphatase [Streptomycetaceae bacterium]|nr:fused response regulator/phosphatase [Streptomycetaceae bacterium]
MSATGWQTDRAKNPHPTSLPDQQLTAEQRATGPSSGLPAQPTTAALPRQRTSEPASVSAPVTPAPFTLLVIGEDPASAFAVPDLLDATGNRARIRHARNLTEARRLLTDDVSCILLDLELGARQAKGLDVLREVLRMAPTTAVLTLASGQTDAELAAEAVRVGAQDYLFRNEIEASLLNRAMRYAVERKRADLAQLQLTETRLRAEENARLERGLLPTPLLDGAEKLRFAARYQPGRSRALLGGDFYDVIRTPNGTVHAMIGDVCGHGPDEAALGVELRIAWRAQILAGLCGESILQTLQQVLEYERPDDEIFATLCTVDIAPDGRRASVSLAGHPSPLLARRGCPAELLPYEHGGPALGLLPQVEWERVDVELGDAWSLMLYTDGLIEGRVGMGTARLGQEGMIGLIDRGLREGLSGEELLDAAVTEAMALNGGELTDDVAVVLLDHG